MAGTIVETYSRCGGNYQAIKFACTADAADGSFPAQALTTKFSGKLLALKTNPGATAPTTLYDITLVDADGLDLLQTLGMNRHTTNSEIANLVFSGTSLNPVADVSDTLTLTIINNDVNSALISITLYILCDERDMGN